jgi:hypothetical protein
MSTAARLRPDVDPDLVVGGVALLAVEFLVVVVYLLLVPGLPTDPTFYGYLLVPFVWINAALWGLARTDVPGASLRRRAFAGAVGLGYLLVLGYAGGLYGAGAGAAATGFRLSLAFPPGWSPAAVYSGADLRVVVLPFKLFGYAVLAYLVYATVLETAGGLVAGVVGLFSCVSCTLPVIAAALSGLVGGAGALAVAASAQSYGLSTAVFVLTVLLLTWRPSVGLSRAVASLRS